MNKIDVIVNMNKSCTILHDYIHPYAQRRPVAVGSWGLLFVFYFHWSMCTAYSTGSFYMSLDKWECQRHILSGHLIAGHSWPVILNWRYLPCIDSIMPICASISDISGNIPRYGQICWGDKDQGNISSPTYLDPQDMARNHQKGSRPVRQGVPQTWAHP